MKNCFIIFASLLLLTSCDVRKKNNNLVGNDKVKGCIKSAGYVWSELKKDCIRPFEEGIQLTSANPEEQLTSYAAYLYIKNNQIEAFLKESSQPILFKKLNDTIWVNGIWSIRKDNNYFFLRKGKELLYKN